MINGQMQSWPAKGMMMTYVIRLTCLDQKYKLRGCGQESGWGVERGEDKHPLQTGQAIATGAVSRPRPSSISFPRKRGPWESWRDHSRIYEVNGSEEHKRWTAVETATDFPLQDWSTPFPSYWECWWLSSESPRELPLPKVSHLTQAHGPFLVHVGVCTSGHLPQ